MKSLISETAGALGIHPQTLRNWERRGIIKPERDWAGRRIFSDEDIEKIKAIVRSGTDTQKHGGE